MSAMKLSRGYKDVREKLKKNPKFTMCCTNCTYYYKCSGDKEEVCQNDNVLKYDMVVSDNRIYCLRWKSVATNTKGNNLRKRGIFNA